MFGGNYQLMEHILPHARESYATEYAWPPKTKQPPYAKLSRSDQTGTFSGVAQCVLGTPLNNRATELEEGVFARWKWDGTRLTAQVDPLGFFSLFYWHDGNTVIVSPSVLQVLAQGADPAPDPRALGVFYRLGMFINEDTPFRNIKVLPPGGTLIWEGGHVSITRRDMPISEQSVSRDTAVEGIIELTRASLRNIATSASGDLVLPLSGGRDSRHILLGLKHLGAPPKTAVTYQHCGAIFHSETRAARAICERVGIRHEVLGHPRPMTSDILRSLTLTSLCSDEHHQMMPMHDYLARRSAVALDGIGGDILTNPDDAAAGHYAHAQKEDFAAIARDMMAGHTAVLCKPGQTAGPGELYSTVPEAETRAYIAEAIGQFRDAPDPYQSFWFWHRTRREIGFVSSAMFATGGAVYCPYLDTRFVQFCLSLPWSVTKDQKLHSDALRRGYPDVQDVGFGNSFASSSPARTSLTGRVKKVWTGFGAVMAMRPARPIAEARQFLLGSPSLSRQSGEVYQFHNLSVNGMTADLAQKHMDRAAHLHKAAPQTLISDVFDPKLTL